MNRACRSITELVRFRVNERRGIGGAALDAIRINPVILDAWRAELLATGKLMPGELSRRFEGVSVEVTSAVSILEAR